MVSLPSNADRPEIHPAVRWVGSGGAIAVSLIVMLFTAVVVEEWWSTERQKWFWFVTCVSFPWIGLTSLFVAHRRRSPSLWCAGLMGVTWGVVGIACSETSGIVAGLGISILAVPPLVGIVFGWWTECEGRRGGIAAQRAVGIFGVLVSLVWLTASAGIIYSAFTCLDGLGGR